MAAAQQVGLEAPPAYRARVRARDRVRMQLGEMGHVSAAELAVDDVPPCPTPKERRHWIATRLVQGLWLTEHTEVLAQAWGLSPRTIEGYAGWASDFVELHTEDLQRLGELAAVRIGLVAECDDPIVALKAAELQLKLLGHLKGGAEHHAPSNAELEAQMVAALRDPDDMMTRWLRAAMSDPGEGMRALLAEFSVPVTSGVEMA